MAKRSESEQRRGGRPICMEGAILGGVREERLWSVDFVLDGRNCERRSDSGSVTWQVSSTVRNLVSLGG
ncbi:hypothetical protein NL676_003977 [Syzygium grande]|nr:hypothetical protein NL676_003977 [Syzygium grande]